MEPPSSSERESSASSFQRLDRTERRPYAFCEYARRALWELVQGTCMRWSPRRAYGWRRWWLRRFGAQLHDTASVRPSTRIMHPWLLRLDAYTMLADEVQLYNLGPVHVGEHTCVSQGVYVCAGTHDHTQAHLPLRREPITIGRGVWVAAQAFIGPGVTVGDNSVVGARAVVMRDVEAGVVVAGNPAQVVNERPMMGADDGGMGQGDE